MLKAASLAYAIFITLIIAILCYALLLIFSLNNNLEDYFTLRKKLLIHNHSAIAVMKANYSTNGLNGQQIFPHEAAISSTISTTNWGAFSKCQINTYSKKDTVQQVYLLADLYNKDLPALYLRDNDEDFKISGNTIINGDVYISGRGIKKIQVSGVQTVENPIHTGQVFTSDKILPRFQPLELTYPEGFVLMLFDDIKTNSVINGFDKKTKVINVGSVLENIQLKGNIIIRSNDTIQVKASAILEDIIIEAPKVVFQEGFIGNLQVFATHEVVLDSRTHLNYPSVIVVGSNESEEKNIVLKENSVLNGAVILYGDGLRDESKNKMIIEPNSKVTGTIFCDGVLAIYGSVNGSVITSSLEHKTLTTNHRNLILNGSIIADKIPSPYFQIQPLEKYKTGHPVILKKL